MFPFRRYQVLAVELLSEYRPGGFRYPKFHANRKYAGLIRNKGCVGLASAGYGESTHKNIKKAWLLSNKKSAGLERQVGRITCPQVCWSAVIAGVVMRTASSMLP